ncbi:MAG TPA: hypothetical protein VF266_26910 [Thermoanaerobaculia bacterium]
MLTDPMALITDGALGLAAWVFAARLWRARGRLKPALRLWALAFLFTGIAAVAGGVFHAFGDEWRLLWKVTTFAVGIASFFLLIGTDRRLQLVATIELVAYLSWMTVHDGFLFVILDYGLAMILVAVFHPAKKWVLGSIGVSVAGALVQGTQVAIHQHWFDHNDLYHVIQIVALWMLFRAATMSRHA